MLRERHIIHCMRNAHALAGIQVSGNISGEIKIDVATVIPSDVKPWEVVSVQFGICVYQQSIKYKVVRAISLTG